jgi:hypothetical protein
MCTEYVKNFSGAPLVCRMYGDCGVYLGAVIDTVMLSFT